MELKTNTQNSSDKKFLTVLSDGKFHLKVEENTPGALERTYTQDIIDDTGKVTGKKDFTVHELTYSDISGVITNMYFSKGLYGRQLIIEIDQDGAVALNASQSYAEQLLRKLPNIDLTKPVTFSPYNYVKLGKKVKGIGIMQDDEKVADYYRDYEKKININGLPEPKTKSDGTVNWTIYFETVREFLEEQCQSIFDHNNFKAPEVKVDTNIPDINKGEVNVNEIDF